MTDHQNETIWITIPDEDESSSSESSIIPQKESGDMVKNKVFWGVGLVALIVFASVLLVPREMATLMQAQLFDGSFQVVPDFEEQNDGALFGEGDGEGSEGDAEPATLGDAGDENVVEAESEAVSIQIEPLVDTETEAPATTEPSEEGAEESAEENVEEGLADTELEDTGSDTEVDELSAEISAEAEPIAVEDTGVSGDTTTLLESLSKQLESSKETEKKNEQMIQELMQLLEDQTAGGVHSAAGSAVAQASPTGAEAAAQIGTGGTSTGTAVGASAGIGAGTPAGTYRYNTHTVTVSPYDILAQNKGAQQASYQADVSYSQVQPYSQQNYNTVLSGVQGQPDTGPADAMMLALLLASFGILVWGAMRAIRA